MARLTSDGEQTLALVIMLDTFSDDFQFEIAGKRNDGGNDRSALSGTAEILYEGAVYLEPRDRQAS